MAFDPIVEEICRLARVVAGHGDADQRIRAVHRLRARVHPDTLRASDPISRALVTRRIGHADACPRILAFCNSGEELFAIFSSVLERARGINIVHGGIFHQTAAWRAAGRLLKRCSSRAGNVIPREAVFDGWLRPKPRGGVPDILGWLRWAGSRVPWQTEQAARALSDLVSLCTSPEDGETWRQVLTCGGGYREIAQYALDERRPGPPPPMSAEIRAFIRRLRALEAAHADLPDSMAAFRLLLPEPADPLGPLLRRQAWAIAGHAVGSDRWSKSDEELAWNRCVETPLQDLLRSGTPGCEATLAPFLGGLREAGRDKLLASRHGQRCERLWRALSSAPDREILDAASGIRAQLASAAVTAGQLGPIESMIKDDGSDRWEMEIAIRAFARVIGRLPRTDAEHMIAALRRSLERAPGTYAAAIFARAGSAAAALDPDWASRLATVAATCPGRRADRDLAPPVVSWILGPDFAPAELPARVAAAHATVAQVDVSGPDGRSGWRVAGHRAQIETTFATEDFLRWFEDMKRGDPEPSGAELSEFWALLRRALQRSALSGATPEGLCALVRDQGRLGPAWIEKAPALTSCREALIALLYQAVGSMVLGPDGLAQVRAAIQQVRSCRTAEQPLQTSGRLARLEAIFSDIDARSARIAAWERDCATGAPGAVLHAAHQEAFNAGGWPDIVLLLLHNTKGMCDRLEKDKDRDTSRAVAAGRLQKCRLLLFDALSGFEEVTDRAAVVRDAVSLAQSACGGGPRVEMMIHETVIGVAATSYLLIVEELVANALRYSIADPVRVFSPFPFESEMEEWDVLVTATVEPGHQAALDRALRDSVDLAIDALVPRPPGSSRLGLVHIKRLATACGMKLDWKLFGPALGVGLKTASR